MTELYKQLVVLFKRQFLATSGTLVLSLNGVPNAHITEYVSTHSRHQATAGAFKLLCSVQTYGALESGLSGGGRRRIGGGVRGVLGSLCGRSRRTEAT